MRICLTHDFDDDFRRALNQRAGRPGLATRDDLVRWVEQVLLATAQEIVAEVAIADEEIVTEVAIADEWGEL